MLDDKQSIQLYWLLSLEDAAAVGAGPFAITLVLDTTKAASAGAWNGRESSNTVQVAFKPEPDEWTADLLNHHWLSLSLYCQLNGDNAASLQTVDTLLSKQPESVPAWARKGEILGKLNELQLKLLTAPVQF